MLSAVIALAALVSLFFMIGFSDGSDADDSGTCGGGLTYTYTESTNTLTITKTDPSGTGEMNDYTFEEAVPWDYYASSITTLSISDGVTHIGDYAFDYCTGITSLTIPSTVTSIGNYAFTGCTGITSLTIPSTVTSIGNYAFSNCTGLTGTLTIPGSMTSIGTYTFNGCRNLTGLSLGNSVVTIGDHSFYDCRGITSLSIPSSVKYISDYAFCDCHSIAGTLTIPDSVLTIGEAAFNDCNKITSLNLGNSVKTIGDYAFGTCRSISGTLTIPDSVTSIGNSAFDYCTEITGVTIGSSVTSIGEDAFSNCSKLTGTITIPDSVTSIKSYAFRNCSNITAVVVGNNVTEIGTRAFAFCSGLTSLTLGNKVESIGQAAFSNCSKLAGTLTIPGSVTSIGNQSFEGCSKFTSITFPDKTFTTPLTSCFPAISSYHQNGAAIASPAWDAVKGKTWYGSGNGVLYNGTLTVTLDPNNGSATTSTTVTYGSTYGDLPAPAPATAAVAFGGWFTAAEGGDEITSTTSVIYADTQTLYAHWVISHTVTYDVDGGSAAAPTQDPVAEGAKFTVAAYSGTKTGHTFGGWNDGSATYAAGDEYTMGTADVTLTAVWVPITHTVTYDVDGGSAAAPTQADVAEGAKFTVAAYSGTKTGHTFGGWNDGSATYAAGSEYTMGTADVTLTAVWVPITHTVTYNVDGGSAAAPTQSDVAEGAKFTVASYSGTKAGFTFGGWNDGTTDYDAGNEYTMGTTDVAFTAVWTPNPTHTVTYNVDGGSAAAPTQADVAEGAKFTVASYSGTKDGFTFGGWNDGSATYATGSEYTMATSDVTLTAVWNLIVTYTVTYNVDGGSAAAPTQADVAEGAKFTVASYSGTKDGFIFGGWNDGSTVYAAGSDYTMGTSDVTLTAVWNASPTPGPTPTPTPDDPEKDSGNILIVVGIVAIIAIIILAGGLFGKK